MQHKFGCQTGLRWLGEGRWTCIRHRTTATNGKHRDADTVLVCFETGPKTFVMWHVPGRRNLLARRTQTISKVHIKAIIKVSTKVLQQGPQRHEGPRSCFEPGAAGGTSSGPLRRVWASRPLLVHVLFASFTSPSLFRQCATTCRAWGRSAAAGGASKRRPRLRHEPRLVPSAAVVAAQACYKTSFCHSCQEPVLLRRVVLHNAVALVPRCLRSAQLHESGLEPSLVAFAFSFLSSACPGPLIACGTHTRSARRLVDFLETCYILLFGGLPGQLWRAVTCEEISNGNPFCRE